MGRIFSNCVSRAQWAWCLYNSVKGKAWYAVALLLLTVIFTGPQKLYATGLQKVTALWSLPDHLWGKWLIIIVAFGLICYGIWCGTKSNAKSASAEFAARSRDLELPTLVAVLGAMSSELRDLEAKIGQERDWCARHLAEIGPWIGEEPFEAFKLLPAAQVGCLVLQDTNFEVRQFPLLGLTPVARPIGRRRQPGRTRRGDVPEKIMYDPRAAENSATTDAFQSEAEAVQSYLAQLEGLMREGSAKVDKLTQDIREKARPYGIRIA